MDFKGITWAGNIYQKFEAMCLEVEEAMYQDTVKYVENQVQKVGVSVKKFYSEVIEDLHPPSCVDPINSPSGDLSLDPYGDAYVIKKPAPSISDSHPTKENKDQVITNVIAKKESSLSGNYDINSLYPRNKCTDSRSVTSKRLGIHRRAIGIKRIPKNNHPAKDSCRIMSSDDVNVMSSGELDVSCKASPVSGTSVGSAVSEKILSAKSLRLNEDDSACVSPASGKELSAESARENKNDLDTVIPAFENNLSAESSRLNEDDLGCGSPASGKELSAESATENKNYLDTVTPAFENNLSAESSRLNEDDSGCVSPASGKELSAESVRENKNDLHTVAPAFENNLSAESLRLNEDDSGCVSPASGKELSAESVRENKNDLGTVAPAFENNLSAESLRLNEDDSGCVSPASGKELSAESVRENKNDLDTSIPAFENNLSAESLRLNEDDSGCVSPASGKEFSAESVRKNKNDLDTFIPAFENNLPAESERLKGDPESTSHCSVLLTESTGTSMKEGLLSVGTTSYKVEPWKKEVILPKEALLMSTLGSSDSFNMEVIKNEGKNLNPVERQNLEESCIMVEGDEIICIPLDSRKNKSYKKKIREALSSKLKLKRDHKSSCGKINGETMILVHSMDTEKKELTAYDFIESEWELL